MLALTVLDVLVFWAWTLGLLVASYGVFATLVYLLAVAGPGRKGALAQDVRHRHEAKRALRSGRRLRSRYLFLLASLLLDAGMQATVLHRMSHALVRAGLRPLAEVLHAVAKVLTNIDVSPHVVAGGGLTFFHGSGAVLGKGTRLGKRVTVCQGVTTGSGRPVIGDDVVLWAGAKVLGDVTVGDRAEVGANAVVLADVPANHIAVGIPARRHLRRKGGRRPPAGPD